MQVKVMLSDLQYYLSWTLGGWINQGQLLGLDTIFPYSKTKQCIQSLCLAQILNPIDIHHVGKC